MHRLIPKVPKSTRFMQSLHNVNQQHGSLSGLILNQNLNLSSLQVHRRNFSAKFGTSPNGKINYTQECLQKWRDDLQSKPELKSSRGKPCSYTDDEIVAWRREFDEYSESVITEVNFEKKVAKKYPKLSGTELHEKVDKKWSLYDLDGSGTICFSEFCIMTFCLDVERLAVLMKEDGIANVFPKYANSGGIMEESSVKQLMKDYNFTCPIDADVRKLCVLMDANKDGKICENDVKAFVEAEIKKA